MWRSRFQTTMLLLAGAVLAAGAGAPAGAAGDPQPQNPERGPAAKPAAGGKDRVTTQPCTVQAIESVQLYSAVPGYLQKQTVDIGDRVKKGQVLAEIDAPLLVVAMKQAELGVLRAQGRMHGADARLVVARTTVQAAQAFVDQRQAEADSAKALLASRQQRLERIKSLYENKSVDARLFDEEQKGMDASRAQHAAALAALANARVAVELTRGKVAQAEAVLEVAKTGGEQARLALEKARVLLDTTRVVAPFDGVVTQRNFSPGDFIHGGAQGSRPLLTIVRTDRMRVIVQIPEREVVLVQPGAPVDLAFDALPGVRFNARVSRVGFAADPASRTMRAEIDVPNPKEQLRPGMYGSATVHLGKDRAGSPPGEAGPPAPTGREGKAETNLKKLLLDEARKVYEQDAVRLKNGQGVEAEQLYVWSRRWLEARVALAANKDERVAAYQDHLQRMADLERFFKALARTGRGSTADASAASYYRVQAELWLTQARAG